MHQINHILVATALAAAVAGAGCKRTITEKEAAPDTQVGQAQQTAITTTITGCLRAGNADGTFVLNEAQSAGGNQAATYQLVAANADDLRAHLNQQVQVVGTIQSDQQVASRSTRVEDDKKAKGTTGTPVVETTTDVRIRRMQVSSVTPRGTACNE